MLVPEYARFYPFDSIIKKSKEHDIEIEFLMAVIQTESGGNQWAFRYEKDFNYLHDIDRVVKKLRCSSDTAIIMQKCSYGLCQIMGATAIDLGLFDLKNPWPTVLFEIEINLDMACKLIRSKIKKYGYDCIDDIYASYNAGIIKKEKGLYVNEWAVVHFRKHYADFKGRGDIRMIKVNKG